MRECRTRQGRLRLLASAVLTAAVVVAATPGPAQAAFPGTNGKIAFSSLSDWEDFDVFVINSDGSGTVNLTGHWSDDVSPAFSPDGSRIAFTSDRAGSSEIYVMDADGTDLARLTNNGARDFDPAFSADGSRIAFASDRDGNKELYTVGADGSGETRLTTSAANEEDPAFSADGMHLAFTTDRDGNREIYVAGADGANPVRLTVEPAADYQPNFSPDGTRIAFTSERAAPAHIFVMRADGSAQTALSPSDSSSDHDPSFSPDGTEVAFAGEFSCPPGYVCGEILGGGIYVTGSDGSGGRTVVDAGRPLADPDWGVATAPGASPPDTTPPDTEISFGPSGPTNDSTPSFGFGGTDDLTPAPQLEYSYKLDHGEWSTYSPTAGATPTLADGPHTIYAKARDQAGNEDATPAERSFTVDTVAPTGTVVIEGGAARTRKLNVTLTLNANDPAPSSGVTTMRLSNTSSGLASASWIPYATTQQWTLSAGAGTKTVYVQYRDAAGKVSPTSQDTIRYMP